MRPPAATIVNTIGSLAPAAQTVEMGIDPGSLDKIMMILTDLYPDPMMAVLREYATNAMDSHLSAGFTGPIEVTLPSAFAPFLKIRDFGLGMDGDTMRRVYSQYGVSTKDNENVSTGMFGIGCKSALTYAQQFTVTAVKDGIRLTAMINRIGAKATMTIIDERITDEPNGVEVSVPVKHSDARLFQGKADYLFGFWKQGTVLVNGKEPVQHRMEKVTDTIFTTAGNQFDSDIVVMGGVPYKVGRNLYNGRSRYGNNFDIVAFVEVGDVDIPPSREEVQMTSKSEATLASVSDQFKTQIRRVIQDDINNAPDHAVAYQRYKKWANEYSNLMQGTLSYKGDALPQYVQFDYALWNSQGYRGGYRSGQRQVDIDTFINNSVVIHGYDVVALTKTHKDKINKWKADNGIVAHRHLLTANPVTSPWLPAGRQISFADIKAIKLPSKTVVNGTRVKPRIDVFNPTTQRYDSITDLDKTKIPVYISPTLRIQSYQAKNVTNVLPEVQLVILGENRWEKFRRETPNAMPLKDYIKKRLNEARDALTADDIKALSMNDSSKSVLSKLDDTLLDDPVLSEMVRISNGTYKSVTLDAYRSIEGLARTWHITVPHWDLKDYLRPYPLIESYQYGTLNKKHAALYLNAVYASNSV